MTRDGLFRHSFIAMSVVGLTLASFARAANTSTAAAPSPELVPYAAVGSAIARQLKLADAKWTEAQLQAFLAGIVASYEGRDYPLDPEAQRLLAQVVERSRNPSASPAAAPARPTTRDSDTRSSQSLQEFLAGARISLSLQTAEAGFLYRTVQPGSGPRPRQTDTIVISIHAMTVSSEGRTPLPELSGEKVRVKVSDLLPGLAKGVQMLAAGGRQLLLLPPTLSFGDAEWPASVPKGTPLFFHITLDDIVPATAEP